MCLFIEVRPELGHIDRELVLDLDICLSGEVVLLKHVLFRVEDGDLDVNGSFSLFDSLGVDRRAVEARLEDCSVIPVLVVPQPDALVDELLALSESFDISRQVHLQEIRGTLPIVTYWCDAM